MAPPSGAPLSERCTLIAGTANPALAGAVARALGRELAACTVMRFPDGEVAVRLDESVRGREVFVIQPTAPPVNDHLMELLAIADACRRAAAARVIAVAPYFGYARGDKRAGQRTPVMARLAADLVECAGVDQLVVVDVHSEQVEGFFHVPVDALTAVPALCEALRGSVAPETVVVSPDLGAARRATEFGRRLALPVAVCQKRRLDGTRVEVRQVIGDVQGRPCLIVDDMITTGGTIAEAAAALRASGARDEFRVAATHGVLVGGAVERMADAGVRELLVTDTVAPGPPGPLAMRVESVAPLLARAIARILEDHSLRDDA